MADYQARIRTKFGELIVSFENREELGQRLKEIRGLANDIEQQLSEFIVKEAPKPIAGFEDLYIPTQDGLPKLLKFPQTKSDVIRLLLFLSPRPLASDEIRSLTGIDNPPAYMTASDFTQLPDELYTITPEGRLSVVSKIVPALRKRKT